MEHGNWLTGGLGDLGAAVLAVPIARLLGLGSIIGYLGAGIAIGPWGLKLVTEAQDMLHFAEFGVVLMLFLVGLELEPRRVILAELRIDGPTGFRIAVNRPVVDQFDISQLVRRLTGTVVARTEVADAFDLGQQADPDPFGLRTCTDLRTRCLVRLSRRRTVIAAGQDEAACQEKSSHVKRS